MEGTVKQVDNVQGDHTAGQAADVALDPGAADAVVLPFPGAEDREHRSGEERAVRRNTVDEDTEGLTDSAPDGRQRHAPAMPPTAWPARRSDWSGRPRPGGACGPGWPASTRPGRARRSARCSSRSSPSTGPATRRPTSACCSAPTTWPSSGTTGNTASPATPTSPTRWPSRPSSPSSAWTPPRWSPRCCTTRSRTPTTRSSGCRPTSAARSSLLVDGVTKLDRVKLGDAAKAETIRKMVVAMAKDPRVLVIKLADRLHNMRTLTFLPRPKQEQKARETLEILAPLAHRLGMNTIKWELEDLAFRTLFPKRFEEINRLIGEHTPQRDSLLRQVTQRVAVDLKAAKIRAEVTGRPKHLYSVYQKMIVRGREFADIYDLVGVRILVDTVRDCYAALGVIHANWQPVPGRFKDYIAMPKFNMYQSLHTTVIGPTGKPVELQIRTYAMHRTAEYGIAAHWRYKETKGTPVAAHAGAHRRDDLAAPAAGLAAGGQRPERVPRRAALRPVQPGGLRLHAEGRRDRADHRLDPGRLRLRRAHRGRAQVHRRARQRQAGAAGERAVQRRRDRDLHLEVGDGRAEPGLAGLRQEPAGAHQDPAVLQQGAPRRGDRGRQGRDRQGDAQAGPPAAAAAHVRVADDHRAGAAPRRRGRALRGRRRRSGLGAVGRPAPRRRLRRRGGRGRGHRRDGDPDPAAAHAHGRHRSRCRGARRRRRVGQAGPLLHAGPGRRRVRLRDPLGRGQRAPRRLRQRRPTSWSSRSGCSR